MLISENSPIRENYFDSNIKQNENAKMLLRYKRTPLKRASPEIKCLHPTSSRREMCTLSDNDVNYHKFSYGAASCTLNGNTLTLC